MKHSASPMHTHMPMASRIVTCLWNFVLKFLWLFWYPLLLSWQWNLNLWQYIFFQKFFVTVHHFTVAQNSSTWCNFGKNFCLYNKVWNSLSNILLVSSLWTLSVLKNLSHKFFIVFVQKIDTRNTKQIKKS